MSETTSLEHDEVSLLDILVVIAESWVLLVVGAVVAAFVGYMFAAAQPVTYRAIAEVALSQVEAERLLERDAEFAAAVPAADMALNRATIEAISRVTVSGHPPELVAEELARIITIFRTSGQSIVDARRIRLQEQIDRARQRVAEIDTAKFRVDSAAERIETQETFFGVAFAELAGISQNLASERYALVQQISGMELSLAALPDDIVTWSTAPTESGGGRSPVVTAGVFGMAAGFLLLVMVFIRHGIRVAKQDPAGSEKMDRIKRALLLRPRTSA